MIALDTLRRRWPSLVGTGLTLAVAVAVLTVCGLLLVSARPVLPARYAAASVLVRPVPPGDPEAFAEPRPWPVERADALVAGLSRLDGVRAAIPVHRFYAQLVRDGAPSGTPATLPAGPRRRSAATGSCPAALRPLRKWR
ncbi:hypothetical protein ACFQY4_28765 [Catellatospora bangladeshensis]|uniref:hypothetical protein n=1 Tax=Catellatospora bangladeshensis TaxID=310355 RepID=UPI00361DC2B8